jgi:hypothetical protein
MDGWGKHGLPPTSSSLSLFSDFAQRAIQSSMRSHDFAQRAIQSSTRSHANFFGFCSESNPIVNAFSRKFFRILLREQSNRQRVLTRILLREQSNRQRVRFCSECNPIVNTFSLDFRILLREQSNRQRVLTQIFLMIKGKSTKAIHMDAPPFIIALSFRWQCQPFGDDLLLEANLQPANSLCHWSFVTIVLKSTLKWPG